MGIGNFDWDLWVMVKNKKASGKHLMRWSTWEENNYGLAKIEYRPEIGICYNVKVLERKCRGAAAALLLLLPVDPCYTATVALLHRCKMLLLLFATLRHYVLCGLLACTKI